MQKAKSSMLLKLVSLAIVITAVLAAGQASAAPGAPATATTGAITTSSIVVNWTSGGGTGDTYLLEQSTNGTTFTVVSSTIATGTLTYTVPSLSVNTQYTFRVAAAEGYAATTTYTTSTAKYTYANPVFTPTVGTPTTSTLPITINTAANPGNVTYGFWNDTTQRWLDAAGAASTTATYQTTSTWGGLIVTATGLSVNTSYRFNVIAQNGDGVDTATSTTSTAKYTYANPVFTPTVGSATTNTLAITMNTAANPSSVTYAFWNDTTKRWLDAAGAASTSATYQATSTWGSLSVTATGLSVNTAYQFNIIARNSDSVDAATSTTSTAKYTLVNPAFKPVVGTPTISTLPITINEANNPSSATYGIWNDTTKRWLDSAGAASTTAVFQTTSTWGGTTVTAAGLTANTSYRFNVIARNGDSVEASTSTTSTAKYTYTNVPSSLVATGNNSQITLTWSGDGTTYYAYNNSDGTNSGWTSASTFTFTNIGCGTTHSVKVKARNGDAVESAYATAVNGTTTGCSASAPVSSPVVVTPVVTVTTTPTVTTTVVRTPVTTVTTPAVVTPVKVYVPLSEIITLAPVKVRIYTFKKYLTIGSSGTEVKQLQTVLKKLGYFTYSKITSYFGSATKAAVVKFQKAKKLKPYPGYVGAGTRAELNKSPANMK